MYYVWTISSDFPNLYWLEYEHATNPDYLDFFDCEFLNIESEIKFHLNKKASLNKFKQFDYVKSDAVPLISEKLASIINKIASKDIQLIPVKVYQEKKLIAKYFIPNVLNLSDCIDSEKSLQDEFDDYTKLVFKPSSLGDHKIVRANGYRDWDLVVNELFVHECEKEKIKGIEFFKEPYFDPLYND
ncbi:DUF1629 domain-containing protein [Algibacter sp. TI.3.09]|uniref:imm11 family protein n=1 Tax=Algibacter sp. TI.3.09 TaxID=3121298 RepID=UPI00311F5BDA